MIWSRARGASVHNLFPLGATCGRGIVSMVANEPLPKHAVESRWQDMLKLPVDRVRPLAPP